MSAAPPALPRFLTRCANDEFIPPPLNDVERRAARIAAEAGDSAVDRLNVRAEAYVESRRGIAAGLLAVNKANNEDFFLVPDEAAFDSAAADDALGGDELIIDVQTHYIAEREACESSRELIRQMYPMYGPDWWGGLGENQLLDFAEYLRCVFTESETAVAVLSSPPGLSEERMLFNEEMAATRLLLERFGAEGRLLNHAVIHAGVDGEIGQMAEVEERIGPVGWKVYTMGATSFNDFGKIHGWFLDDAIGTAFLEQVMRTNVRVVCAHKGLSGQVAAGSPRDFGIAANRYPDIKFVAYHSGFEPGDGRPSEDTREGPYEEATAHIGVNRLIESIRVNDVAPGSNIYAELGTTWYCLIKRPLEAAHVLGKLLNAVGPDNVLWGTDGIWYGPTQGAVDTFRAFQIPEWMQETYGYPELTPELKQKILGMNATAVYGIDPVIARRHQDTGDLAWIKGALEEFHRSGTPTM
jgi:predicted TIM-barrel fold metal-dependent hydrolase